MPKPRGRRWVLLIALGAAALAVSLPRPVSGEGRVAAPPATAQPASPEETLALRHAPVLYLAEQSEPCGPGDPYYPVPVETVLGDPRVALVQNDGEGRRVLAHAPTAADLYRRDESFFLDFPGDPRRPGCDYERSFAARPPQPAVAYARVARDPDRPSSGLALQYWFFYPFNGANNTHEGDWELVQLAFAAPDAAGALARGPDRIAYSQHRGGETARWTDAKVGKEGDRPVVHVAAGSHANYFGAEVYLRTSVVGCDDAAGPDRRLALAPVLLPAPEEIGPESPFAWLTFAGRWGEEAPWRWTGALGPNTSPQWRTPLAWHDGLRRESIRVAADDPARLSPAGAVCVLAGRAALATNAAVVHPGAALAAAVGLATLVLATLGAARRCLAAAARLYARRFAVFAAIGLMTLLPVWAAAALAGRALAGFPEPAPALVELGLLAFAVPTLVAPAAARATAAGRAGRSPHLGRALADAAAQFPTVAAASLRAMLAITALAATVVGLPLAARQAVRWSFVAQAALGGGGTGAAGLLAASAGTGAGRPWRAAATLTAACALAAIPGPALALALMLGRQWPLDRALPMAGLVLAATIPFVAVASTVFHAQGEG